ncbi:hypothetical protein AAULR_03879 [Lacticaseibacillus rhamnosus MTCC 5462]|nr:hypothetical protein AAULR_03879 [Lacticaseibacillus rhamnosus MTCC 5462]
MDTSVIASRVDLIQAEQQPCMKQLPKLLSKY